MQGLLFSNIEEKREEQMKTPLMIEQFVQSLTDSDNTGKTITIEQETIVDSNLLDDCLNMENLMDMERKFALSKEKLSAIDIVPADIKKTDIYQDEFIETDSSLTEQVKKRKNNGVNSDKINYNTHIVTIDFILELLSVIYKSGEHSFEKMKNEVLPKYRSEHGKCWKKESKDILSYKTIQQYGLIKTDKKNDTIFVTKLGEKVIKSLESQTKIKIAMILHLNHKENDWDIHYGRMLFNLLLDPDLEYYQTPYEYNLWTTNKDFRKDEDYENIKLVIINSRRNNNEFNGEDIFLKENVYRILNTFVSWGILKRYETQENKTMLHYMIHPHIKEILLSMLSYENVEDCIKNLDFFDDIEIKTEEIIADRPENIDIACDKPLFVDESKRLTGGQSIIYVGVPGCGKSYLIKGKYCKNESNFERVVLSESYDYDKFIGSFRPTVKNGMSTIEFVPGPFAIILKKAYHNPCDMYSVIVEEYNRGNPKNTFGELFQIIERNSTGKSMYNVSNADLAEYVFGNRNTKIYLPSNLNIIASMNKSVEGVQIIDTAENRRWKRIRVSNKFQDIHPYKNDLILDTTISWEKFCNVFNSIIENDNTILSEDKPIGIFYVEKEELKYSKQGDEMFFAGKIIEYLWGDIFSFSKKNIFKDSINSSEKLLELFCDNEKNKRFHSIFKEEICNKLGI